MSTPAFKSCASVPPLPDCFQRCAVLSAQRTSNPATPLGQLTSGNFSDPPAQESKSFPSLLQQRFDDPAAFLKQTVSPDAKRRMPVVDGEAVPLMKVPVKGEDPPPPPELPPGTLSTVKSVSAGAHVGPSVLT